MATTTFERSRRSASSPAARIGRIAARGLVTLGFAGVAWLLSSSAAHADDGTTDVHPATGVLPGLVSTFGGEAYAGTPDPLLTRREPTRLLTRNDPLTRIVRQSTTAAVSRGTAVDRRAMRAIAVPRAERPVKNTTGKPRKKVKTGGPDISYATTRRVAKTAPVGVPAAHDLMTGARSSATTRGGTATGTDANTTRRPAAQHRAAYTGRQVTALPVLASHEDRVAPSGTRHVPQFPRPAPAPVVPVAGVGTGAPSTSSGPFQDGGLTAIVPAANTVGTTVEHRPEAAADVEVRRLVADSPTVSPD